MNDAPQQGATAAHPGPDAAFNLAQDTPQYGVIPDPGSILDQARDAIIVLGLDGAVRYWNAAAENSFEWSAAEAMDRHVQDFLWVGPHSADDALSGVLARGVWKGRMPVVTKSGKMLLVESRWSLLRDGRTQSRSILTMHSEIADPANGENELSRSESLDTIGSLARGFAHDLNNVLGPIIMAADLFKLMLKSPHELSLLETVEVSAKRGSDIVKQMLAFSKISPRDSDADFQKQRGDADGEFPPGHGELILLIDDENSIRVITGHTLESYGYRVITAAHGSEGLAKYSTRRDEISLVITDMMMPVMGGTETIRALLEFDPLIRIIASSGVNMKGAEEDAARSGVRLFLRKPYSVARLLGVVEEALHPDQSA